EQLGLVLAERSTGLIAVMPEDEKPDRLGGTAQGVAHRLNGWRAGGAPFPRPGHAGGRGRVRPPPPVGAARRGSRGAVPTRRGGGGGVRGRAANGRGGRAPPPPRPARSGSFPVVLWHRWQSDPDVLIKGGRANQTAARSCCPLLRSIEAFNCAPPVWRRETRQH